MNAVKQYEIPWSNNDAFNTANYIVEQAISYQWTV